MARVTLKNPTIEALQEEIKKGAKIVSVTLEVKSKKDIEKEKALIDNAINAFGKDYIGNLRARDVLADFISYRKEIKKPVKTFRPLAMFLRELEKLYEDDFDVETCIEEMMFHEWQTIKYRYFKKDGSLNRDFM